MTPLPPALATLADIQIRGLNDTVKVLEGTSKAVALIAANAAWYVGVVNPGFLGLMWNAKELSETFRLGPEWFYVFFIAAQGCFLTSIVSSMLTHQHANSLVGTLAEHSIHIVGLANDFERAKSSGLMDPRYLKNEEEFRVKLHDMEVKVTRGPARYMRIAEKAYSPAGIIGYVLVGIIFSLTRFGGNPVNISVANLWPFC